MGPPQRNAADCQAANRSIRMRQFAQKVAHFLKAEDGPTAVEYAVMLALIIVVCIAAITALGTNANQTFTTVSGVIVGAGSEHRAARSENPHGVPGPDQASPVEWPGPSHSR